MTLQGAECESTLFYSGGSKTVTLQGKKYGGDLYMLSGGKYYKIGFSLYYGGNSATYSLRGSAYSGALYQGGVQKTFYKRGEEYTDALYKQGASLTYTQQGEEMESRLFYPGEKQAGGLYTNLVPATVTTRSVSAITV